METEGLKRSFDHLQGWGFCPHVLVTDRHFGVNALMKTNFPNTKHRFDAWHVAKGNFILSQHILVFSMDYILLQVLLNLVFCRFDAAFFLLC